MTRFKSTEIHELMIIAVRDDLKTAFMKIEEMATYGITDSREKSVAMTRLEEAAMWFNKALAHDQREMDKAND